MSRYASELDNAIDVLAPLVSDDLGALSLSDLVELTVLTARLRRRIDEANRRIYAAIKSSPER